MRREAAPFLKWAGGKAQLLSQMDPFFPRSYRTYYEVFLGGGAVFFHLRPQKAVLSDLNPELIAAYREVRDHPKAVIAALDCHEPNRSREEYFYQVRDLPDPTLLSPIQKAARTIFLNRTCFNGLYRVNTKGKFNVPWGSYRNPALYDRKNILAVSRLLKGKRLMSADYRRALATARFGDFVYLDPPYHPLSETSKFTSYTTKDFREREQCELADTFRELDKKGVLLMLSNSPTSLVRSLYDGYHVETLRAKRAINCKGTGRGDVHELLVMNYS